MHDHEREVRLDSDGQPDDVQDQAFLAFGQMALQAPARFSEV